MKCPARVGGEMAAAAAGQDIAIRWVKTGRDDFTRDFYRRIEVQKSEAAALSVVSASLRQETSDNYKTFLDQC